MGPPLLLEGLLENGEEWDRSSPVGKMIVALRAGNHLSAAARYGGLHPATVQKWLQRGREWETDDPAEAARIPLEHRVYVALARQVSLALASCEVELVTSIRLAAREDPKIAFAFLSRRFPAWNERRALEVTVAEETPVQDWAARLLAEDPQVGAAAEQLMNAVIEASVIEEATTSKPDVTGDG